MCTYRRPACACCQQPTAALLPPTGAPSRYPFLTDPCKMKAWLAVCACMLLLSAVSATNMDRLGSGLRGARRLQQAGVTKDPTTREGARLCR
jgi:hypothetical protein